MDPFMNILRRATGMMNPDERERAVAHANQLRKNVNAGNQTVAGLVADYNELLKVKIGIQEDNWKLCDDVLKLSGEKNALTFQNNELIVQNNELNEEKQRLLNVLEVHKAAMNAAITSLKGPLNE